MSQCVNKKKRTLLILLVPFIAWSITPDYAAAESLVIQQYKKAVELDPANLNARYQLAVALLREKLFNEALEQLSVVKKGRPEDPQISYYTGIARAGKGELEEALKEYDNVLTAVGAQKAKSEYGLETVYYNIGISYQKEGLFGDAVNAYRKSALIDPAQLLAYCRLGEAYYSLKNYSAALENLLVCEAGSLDKEEVKRQIVAARIAKGIELINNNKYPDALIEFRKAHEAEPESENTQYFLGYGYYLTADFRNALSVLSKLTSPESTEIYNNLPALLQNIALEFNEREDWENAEKAGRQAIELKRGDADLRYLLGYIRLKKNDYEGALREVKHALVLDPSHSKATLTLAIIIERTIDERLKVAKLLFSGGNYSGALDAFNTVIELDPKNASALEGVRAAGDKIAESKEVDERKRLVDIEQRLASADKLFKEDKFKDALSAYRYVLSLDQENVTALQGAGMAGQYLKEKKEKHLTLGDTYYSSGRHYFALREYRSALNYDPDDNLLRAKEVESADRLKSLVKPLIEKAVYNEGQGDLREAMSGFNSALELDPENTDALAGRKRASKNLEVRFAEKRQTANRLLKEKNYIEALQYLKSSLHLKPDEEDLKQELAKVREVLLNTVREKLAEADRLAKSGNHAAATNAYEEVLSIDETNLQAQEGLADVKKYLVLEIEQRLAVAEKAYEHGSWHQAWQLYGNVLSIDKDNKTAREMRLKVRQKLDDLTAPALKRAMEAYNKGDTSSAALEFKKALNVDPSNETAKKYLAGIDSTKFKKSVAEKVEKLYMKGIQLYTEGKYTDAIKVWEEVLELSPGHDKASMNIKRSKKKLEGVMDAK